MSNRYKGGIISATPPTTSGPYQSGAASGAWTLEQQMQVTAAGTWPTAGNIDPSAFIENLFSTYLYTGNGSTQTITNGIDLAGKGGLVWLKPRSNSPTNNLVVDTVRGVNNALITNTTGANVANSDTVTAFASNGFSVGTAGNVNAYTYASWTFREQPKFFDVVTYTGTGSTQNISHNLGSAPGMIVVKSTTVAGTNWFVYHRSLGVTSGFPDYVLLNTTATSSNGSSAIWASVPTSTTFSVGSGASLNQSGASFVAYLFAHDAGGFGLTGTDNVISCGSYTGNGTTQTISLGYEPQWVLIKETTGAKNWYVFDNIRGMSANGSQFASPFLKPNDALAEDANTTLQVQPTATGLFIGNNTNINESTQTYIYIAIRRGPMKVPTSGTSVFSPAYGAYTTGTVVTTGFPVDLQMGSVTGGSSLNSLTSDRLRGVSTNATASSRYLVTSSTAAEATTFSTTQFWNNTGFQTASAFDAPPSVFWNFRRAPNFMDVVCYTGTGSNLDVAHNLGVAPELIITKTRGTAGTNWWTFSGFTGSGFNRMALNLTDAASAFNYAVAAGFYSQPTATTLPLSSGTATNTGARTYVQYLFATCAGVSKVGSYTGTGATQIISCGFTGGARWVMIKRTDSTGDWYVWDTARGMVAGTDPSLLLNSTAAEVNANSIYTTTGGFQIVSTAAGINASGGTYIFLAIA